MLLKRFFVALSCFALFSIGSAQITTHTENIVEDAVIRPKSLDSLSDFRSQKEMMDYKQYIGHQIYMMPRSKKYVPKEDTDSLRVWLTCLHGLKTQAFKQASWTDYSDLYHPIYYEQSSFVRGFRNDENYCRGEYFIITDVQAKKGDDDDYKYVSLKEARANDYSDISTVFKFVLYSEKHKDTLFYASQNNSVGYHFILVPYFLKAKDYLLNKNLIAVKSSTNKVDAKTGEIITINVGDKWTCTDVSIADTKDNLDMVPLVFLKNEKGESTTFPLHLINAANKKNFVLETDYLKEQAELKKAQEQRLKEEKERFEQIQKEKEEKRVTLIKLYGAKIGGYINEGKVVLGMTKDQCLQAWGSPIRTHEILTSGGTREQWVYGWATYLYFSNNILTSIQR